MAACLVAACIATGQDSHRRILIEANVAAAPTVGQLGLDVWSVQHDRGVMEVRVSPFELDGLRAAGIDPTVIDKDIYATSARRHEAHPAPAGEEPWTTYHDLERAFQFMDELHAAYPNTSALFEFGATWEGRPMRGIRIGANAATIDDRKPAILITGCHHAREWISVEVPLYILARMLESYGSDPQITAIMDRGEIWFVPITNPDGFKFTEIDRFWRKNRRVNGDGSFGVDLNRNYSYEWGHDNGSSGNPKSETYRGPKPFSEPETQAVRDLYLERDFAAGVTYHSYAQYVMSPWGYTTQPPPGSDKMEDLVGAWATIVNDAGDNPFGPYVSGRWGVVLYIGSGIFVDWVFGDRGVPGAIVELPPRTNQQGGFELPPQYILPTCEENYPGAVYMIEQTFFDWCPSDCNRTTGTGRLDILDFVCFQQAFVAGAAHADCNQDGVLTIEDFICFQEAFVAGCPWPDG
jgi:hypothetical protein